MTETVFGIQDMIDRVAACWGRRELSRHAELVVDVAPPVAQGAHRLLGDLDQLVARLETLGHAALAEVPDRGSIVLTIQDGGTTPLPAFSMPRSRLLRFNMQASAKPGGLPGSAPYFFEQLFAPVSAAPAPAAGVAAASLRSRRVLAIDDNPAATRVLVQWGCSLGLSIDGACDTDGALRALALAQQAHHVFDLVLLDARLPPPDALACARRLRDAGCRAPLVVMAGPGDAEVVAMLSPDQPLGRELGVAAVLRKPLVDGAALARACLVALHPPLQRSRGLPASPGSFPPSPTMTTSAVPAPAGLPDLPGIDTAIGRASTLNNDRLYRRLLIKFRDAQQGAMSEVAQAWAAGDVARARRLAHDLASVSGTLGAMRLHDVARRLETICAGEADAAGLQDALKDTGDELAQVLAGLQRLGAE